MPDPRATTANAKAASAATIGKAQPTCCQPTFTTSRPRASSPHPNLRPTLKSPRAVTTHAPSASSPTCAANSARAALNRSSPKLTSSSLAASRRSPSSARTPPATAKILASKTASPLSSTHLPKSKACAGSASSTHIPTALQAVCSTPSQSTTTSANISMYRYSTRHPPSSKQ